MTERVGTVRVRISGPLLVVNRFVPTNRSCYCPQDIEQRKYLDDDGNDCIAARAVKRAMCEIARLRRRKRIFVSGTYVVPSALCRGQELLRIDYEEQTAHRINTPLGLYRWPLYRNWSAEFDIRYDCNRLPAQELVNCLREAGRRVGVHAWRRGLGGSYGHFDVEILPEDGPLRAHITEELS